MKTQQRILKTPGISISPTRREREFLLKEEKHPVRMAARADFLGMNHLSFKSEDRPSSVIWEPESYLQPHKAFGGFEQSHKSESQNSIVIKFDATMDQEKLVLALKDAITEVENDYNAVIGEQRDSFKGAFFV